MRGGEGAQRGRLRSKRQAGSCKLERGGRIIGPGQGTIFAKLLHGRTMGQQQGFRILSLIDQLFTTVPVKGAVWTLF